MACSSHLGFPWPQAYIEVTDLSGDLQEKKPKRKGKWEKNQQMQIQGFRCSYTPVVWPVGFCLMVRLAMEGVVGGSGGHLSREPRVSRMALQDVAVDSWYEEFMDWAVDPNQATNLELGNGSHEGPMGAARDGQGRVGASRH